jgi:hypothetical protein
VQRGFLLVQGWKQIVLVEFAKDLALMDEIPDIHRQLLNNSAGFRFDFNLRDGLDFAGRHNRTRQIDTFHLCKLLGIDLRRLTAYRLQRKDGRAPENEQRQADPENTLSFLRRHIEDSETDTFRKSKSSRQIVNWVCI